MTSSRRNAGAGVFELTILLSMLMHTEAIISVQVDRDAHFLWERTVEFTYDCFVCRRGRRTVFVTAGAEEGRCISSQKPPELVGPGIHSFSEVSFVHPAPVRISAFDVSQRRDDAVDRHTLRCRLSYWSAPFRDAKRGETSMVLSNASWIRLGFNVGCRACYSRGHAEALQRPGKHSIQTNMIWPWSMTCPTCERTLLTADTGPAMSLIELT
jgi:hypothetical protein